ncbi:GNAT family N-acetyltransferase [Catellatospora tritici]|uniref:GNAT family N-acetyltransferase n=1 Tax=Catellatospora tritici TaxID=2851566 RepID=UPI001C2D362C|nr:GNAT family N-acetyltransferase [Catellatospora tritici]MBV1853033.1 GNAT family N-acetyltransferase [Catellatospora tritici]
MPVRSVHDREELAGLLGRDPARYAYQLGDLDDFFWPYTTWYRRDDALALVYHGGGLPTLLAFDPDGPGSVGPLLRGLLPLLPGTFYAHLSPGAETVLAEAYRLEPGGPHLKMALTDPAALAAAEPLGDVLDPADLPELSALYDAAYPGNWFDRRMLETGQYVGVRRDGRLLAVAGVHVWSPAYRVSALGNVTTHPDVRGQGLARGAVAALCRRLRETVDHVTLNVHADNAAALALYARLGFTPIAEYGEFTCVAR